MEKKCFEQYRIASGLTTSTKEKQVSTLLYCIGKAAESVLTSTNVIYEHTRFNRRNQQWGETTEQYITELYRFAENCEYGTLKDETIRDHISSCRHKKHVLTTATIGSQPYLRQSKNKSSALQSCG